MPNSPGPPWRSLTKVTRPPTLPFRRGGSAAIRRTPCGTHDGFTQPVDLSSPEREAPLHLPGTSRSERTRPNRPGRAARASGRVSWPALESRHRSFLVPTPSGIRSAPGGPAAPPVRRGGALEPDRPARQGLRHRPGRPARARRQLERRGANACSATPRPRSSAGKWTSSSPPRTAGRPAAARAGDGRRRGQLRGRELGRPQGRVAVLGQRRQHVLRDEAGGLRGFVKIFRDQTQRRQAEEALPRERGAAAGGPVRRPHGHLALGHPGRPADPRRSLARLMGLPAAEHSGRWPTSSR